MLPFVFLILGFLILVKGADLLVKGAASMARRLHVSDLVIGLTVVAFGTSTPELFVNLLACIKGNTDIAIGNVLGSNIANTFLILGLSAAIYPLSVGKGTVWKEIPLSLLAAVVFWIVSNDRLIEGRIDAALTRIDGLVLLCFFLIFLYYSFGIAKAVEGLEDHIPQKQYGPSRSILYILLGLIGLSLGGKWIVDGAVEIAKQLGMSQSTIGLTIVAVGTSLPELATSATAAYRKNVEIAVGNVVGSNIFNIFFILGISALVKPLPFHTKNNVDIGMVILGSLFLFFSMFTGKRRSLDRWEGIVFLCIYLAYTIQLLLRG
jgi:cation:H+ antiporter